MHAPVLPDCGLRLPLSCPFNPRLSLRKPFCSHGEIADGALLFDFRKYPVQSLVLSIRSDGNRRRRPPHRKTPPDQTGKPDEAKKGPELSNQESSDSTKQEEIIALFRRIQSSISKGLPTTPKTSGTMKKEQTKQQAKPNPAGLNQYPTRKQARDKNQKPLMPRRAGASKKAPSLEDDHLPKESFNLSRPPSNFARRSPIPVEKVNAPIEASSAQVSELEPLGIDNLKLVELKELAKSKGVKGYSKLKKGELQELLKGLMRS